MNTIITIIWVTVLSVSCSLRAFSQDEIKSFKNEQYVNRTGMWYIIKNGNPVARVDIHSILVTKTDCSVPTNELIQTMGTPTLELMPDRVAGCWHQVRIPANVDPFHIANRFQQSGLFSNVMFNILIPVHESTPDDALYGWQWHLPKINAPNAWGIITGDTSVIIAVIDGGSKYDHEDLDENLWPGIGADYDDFDGDTDNDPMPQDSAKHGTAVAGLIAAKTNSLQGIAGVAGGWGGNGCRLMHFDVGHFETNPFTGVRSEVINTFAAAKAIDSAASWGARIVSMSFGWAGPLDPIDSAIQRAVTNYDVLFVGSAGNSVNGSTLIVHYPAVYSDVIAVGATDINDVIKDSTDWKSCFGNELDVMSPGVNIWTTDLYDSLGYSPIHYTQGTFAGTSASAPIVAGVLALKFSINPESTSAQARQTLRLSADKVPAMGNNLFHSKYGYGRVNAYKAVRNLYVPSVYTHIDSTFPVIKPGQAIILERDSGRHTLDSIRLLPPHTTLEIHPGATLVIEDTLIIDSTAVIRLFSDSGIAKIEFGPNGLLEIRHPLSLKGKGVIESANILFKKDFQVEADDSLVFRLGGHFSFGPPQRVININGVVVFDSGTFVLGDSLRAIYVNSGDSARLETLPGTTLEGIPNIQAWVPSLLRSHCTEDLPCYWIFKPVDSLRARAMCTISFPQHTRHLPQFKRNSGLESSSVMHLHVSH